jgi:hypothetical protein
MASSCLLAKQLLGVTARIGLVTERSTSFEQHRRESEKPDWRILGLASGHDLYDLFRTSSFQVTSQQIDCLDCHARLKCWIV